MRAKRWTGILALGLIVSACGGGGGSEGPKDNPFGFNNIGVTSIETRALAVSPDGASIVGTDSGLLGTKPVGWLTGNAAIRLNVLAPGDNFSVASGVSGDGGVVVGYGSVDPAPATGIVKSGNPTAVRWTPETGAEGLPNLPGGLWSYATSVSSDGLVIAGASVVTDQNAPQGWSSRAALWTNGAIEDMGLPAGRSNAVALRLSDDGSVVIGVFDGVQAFRWTRAGGYQLLPPKSGASAFIPAALSSDGTEIVGTSGGQAVRWAGGQTSGLGILGTWPNSAATGISGDGSRVVGYASSSPILDEANAEAFIWDPLHGMRSLAEVMRQSGMSNAFVGWTSSVATAISTDGHMIVGYGFSPRGKIESWSARIP